MKLLFLGGTFLVIVFIYHFLPPRGLFKSSRIKVDSRNVNQLTDIIGNSRILWSPDWIKKEGESQSATVAFHSKYGGSEFNFKFIGSGVISFKLSTTSNRPLIGIEIWLDEKKFDFSFPNLADRRATTIDVEESEGRKTHHLRGRVYCYLIPEAPCDFRLNGIETSKDLRLLNKGKDTRKSLVILGDSLSGIYGSQNYFFLLSDKINYYLLNASYSRSTMAAEGGILPGVTRIKEIISLQPDLLIISLGSNDLGHHLKFENFVSDYRKTVELIRAELPETEVILLGLLPRNDFAPDIIVSYSEAIEKIASDYHVHYLNPGNWLTSADLADGLHPTLAAQEKLAENLYTYLIDNHLLSIHYNSIFESIFERWRRLYRGGK